MSNDDEDLKAAQFLVSEMNRTMTPSPDNACGHPTPSGPCVLDNMHYNFVGHWSAVALEREKHWRCVADEVACDDPKCCEKERRAKAR